MTREEAITIIDNLHLIGCGRNQHEDDLKINEALDMAIEALQFVEHFDLLKEYQSLQEVVMCKDCRYANECHKSVQYTRNEPNSVTIGYTKIDFCSHGERSAE